MAMWISLNHETEFSEVETIFWDGFRAKFEKYFMTEFIAVNDSLESCKIIIIIIIKIKQKLKFLD